jgi:PKD repeat protein
MKIKKTLLVLSMLLFSIHFLSAQTTATITIPDVIETPSGSAILVDVPIIMEEISQGFYEIQTSFHYEQFAINLTYSGVLFTNPMFPDFNCEYGASNSIFTLTWAGSELVLPNAGDTLFVVQFYWLGQCSNLEWIANDTYLDDYAGALFDLTLNNGSVCDTPQPTATLTIPEMEAVAGLIEVPLILEEITGGGIMGMDLFFGYDQSHLTFVDVVFSNPMFPNEAGTTYGAENSEVYIDWSSGGVPPAPTPANPGDTLFIVQFQWDGGYSEFIWNTDDTHLGHEPPIGSFELTFNNGSVILNPISENMEDFETGDFTKFDWQFAGDADWQMEIDNPYEGSFSAKSGDIGDNQTSELSLMVDVVDAGPITFFVKTSSEYIYDDLRFFIDNEEVGAWSGEQDWQQQSYNVPLGTHFFRWVYQKDFAVSMGEDCAWVDNIVFPGGNTSLIQADFFANFTDIDIGDTVYFTDISNGDIQSWEWSFPGGDPAVSSEQNPMVVYNSTGSFAVTLTVSDGTESSSLTKEDYIHVDDCQLCGDVLIIDLTDDHQSAMAIDMSLVENEIIATTMYAVPTDFGDYQAVFVCLGMDGFNHVLTEIEGLLLYDYLISGKNLYMEGGNTWYWDNLQGNWTTLHPLFNIIPLGQDYSNVMTLIYGQNGSLAEGLNYEFSSNSEYHDYIDNDLPAVMVLKSDHISNPGLFGRCVSYDVGYYRTVGSSIEFEELADGDNTRDEYMEAILEFFDVIPGSPGYIEDFETGDFSKFDWQFGGDADWEIDGNIAMDNYSARSGDIGDDQVSELFITRNVTEAGTISFNKKTSSENNFDKLSFYIDNQLMSSFSGENDWNGVGFAVNTIGIHTFKWVYSKDYAVSTGEDAVWVDNIVFPPSEPACPPVVAGFTATMGNASMLFQSTSEGDISDWEWDFGDGTSGTGENIAHYYEPGTYTVCLTVYSACDNTIDTYCEEITVEGCPPCVSYFDYVQDPNDIYTVYFNNVPVDSIASWFWEFGDGTSSNEQLPTHTYASEGIYEVCLTVYSSCSYCADTYCADITIDDPGLYNLGGTVFADIGPIDEGFAYLYKMEGSQIVDVFASFISEFGFYDFYQLEEGDYILKAELSPNSPLYNQYIPTYYGDVPNWVNASVIHLQANTWNADVNMIPISNASPGTGSIAGQILKEIKYINEFGPVADVEVLLLDEDNTVLEYAYTDSNGIFKFSEIGFGTYKVLVEVMGKYSNPVIVTLTETNQSVENLDFVIFGENISLSVDENLPEYISSIGIVYPNPVVSNARLEYNLSEPATVQVNIVNILGQVAFSVSEKANPGLNTLDINTNNLENGVYYIQLNFNNSYRVVRKFVKAN